MLLWCVLWMFCMRCVKVPRSRVKGLLQRALRVARRNVYGDLYMMTDAHGHIELESYDLVIVALVRRTTRS